MAETSSAGDPGQEKPASGILGDGRASRPATGEDGSVPPPTNPLVTALLTDMYQLTMAYAYWKAGKHNDKAVFDLLHRKNPFGGEYTVFAGLEECIRFAVNFRFTDSDIKYLRSIMPACCEDGFFTYLKTVDCSEVEIHAIAEGSVCFPRVPLIQVEGPLLVTQLLETTFLTLVNYASLVATNAARFRQVAGKEKILLEFGLRRAQGPDGGISGSRYCYLGGFDATSNIEAGRRFGIPVRGTHSHAFVSSYMSFDEITERSLESQDGASTCEDFVHLTIQCLDQMKEVQSLQHWFGETNHSELAAFTSYALAFPSHFQALVDTYDVLKSGIPNFCAVALALNKLGYKAVGIRLDSGDLAYFSVETRKFFRTIEKEFKVVGFGKTIITASNDISEDTLDALNKQGHEIDAYGIGTMLVTCFKQPALGCVYKLVEINGQPRIKLSEDVTKVTIPCKKRCYRLYGKEAYALVDLMLGDGESPPQVGERILCRHPFSESKRAYVIPNRVEPLYKCYWRGKSGPRERLPSLEELKAHCQREVAAQRCDHVRAFNPTPYKIFLLLNGLLSMGREWAHQERYLPGFRWKQSHTVVVKEDLFEVCTITLMIWADVSDGKEREPKCGISPAALTWKFLLYSIRIRVGGKAISKFVDIDKMRLMWISLNMIVFAQLLLFCLSSCSDIAVCVWKRLHLFVWTKKLLESSKKLLESRSKFPIRPSRRYVRSIRVRFDNYHFHYRHFGE